MTIIQNDNANITLEQAQELLTDKQVSIMQETEEFANQIIELQENENKNLIIQDDQKQADALLNNI
jgi:hypothetical protein